MKRKLICLLLTCLCITSLCGCDKKDTPTSQAPENTVGSESNDNNDKEDKEDKIEESDTNPTTQTTSSFKGFPELDVNSACNKAFSDNAKLDTIINITQEYYNRLSSVFNLYDGTFNPSVPPTEFDSTSDNSQKRIKYTATRPFYKAEDYPQDDLLKEVISELRFFDDSMYSEDVKMSYIAFGKASFKMQDYHKKLISAYMPDQDINSIESALNELIEYSKDNNNRKSIKIIDERDYKLSVDCSYNEGKDYVMYTIRYQIKKSL